MPKEKSVRAQLNMLKPFTTTCSLDMARKGQSLLGGIIAGSYRKQVHFTPCTVGSRSCVWALPFDETRTGVVLYIHGGGFTCGDLEYAKGFGAMLAAECQIRVLCASYRLAPEDPFPAGLEDCLDVYYGLIDTGYPADKIFLCGESAGGGLIYSMCLYLKQHQKPMPGGVIALSPWVDLTQSAPSYATNAKADPSITKERLDFYTQCYTKQPTDPLVSPLFGDLTNLPPSLIFVGDQEVMLDDSLRLHDKLCASGCSSQLVVGKGLWHAYPLYALKEHHQENMSHLLCFLQRFMPQKRKLRWMRLDNAAKIYPAAKKKNWHNMFRIAFTLKEAVDPAALQAALDVTVRRFPSVAVRVRRGMFWYYLEEIRRAPAVLPDRSWPLYHTPFDDVRECAFRVLYYDKRIAVEFFHAVTDGTGGMQFAKTLVCEYLTQKYQEPIPNTFGILDRLQLPQASEMEDSFLRYAGKVCASRKDTKAYQLRGDTEPDGFIHVTTGVVPIDKLKERSAAYGVSVTAFLGACVLWSILQVRAAGASGVGRNLPIKVQIPVNLRRFFPSNTLRNFVYFFNLSIDPSLGEYSFEEVLKIVEHQMGLELNAKVLQSRFTTNVRTEQNPILRAIPLFLKNVVMKAVYQAVGEQSATTCLSNLGQVQLPEEMEKYVDQAEFILSVQPKFPYNCSAVSLGNKLAITLTRAMTDPMLARVFFTFLVKQGIPVTLQSNLPGEE